MTEFIDLQRRFRELSDSELEDIESLLAWSGSEFGPDIGWSELLEYARVILLAEAGAGKTEEMREQTNRLTGEGRFAFFISIAGFKTRTPLHRATVHNAPVKTGIGAGRRDHLLAEKIRFPFGFLAFSLKLRELAGSAHIHGAQQQPFGPFDRGHKSWIAFFQEQCLGLVRRDFCHIARAESCAVVKVVSRKEPRRRECRDTCKQPCPKSHVQPSGLRIPDTSAP